MKGHALLALLLFLSPLLSGCGSGEAVPSESEVESLVFLDEPSSEPEPESEPESATETPTEPSSQPEEQPPADPIPTATGSVDISFNYQKQDGMGSNQFAVWIENEAGRLIKTVYVTAFTARGGWQRRSQALPQWVKKADAPSIPRQRIDAITTATPVAGQVTCTWDCTDDEGAPVPVGRYYFVVEANLRGELRAIHVGTIDIGGEAAEATADFDYIEPELTPWTESAEPEEPEQPVPGEPNYELSGTEREMIGTVTAKYTPEPDPSPDQEGTEAEH